MFSVFKEELVHSSVCTSEPILRSFQLLKNVCPEPKTHNLSIFGSVTPGAITLHCFNGVQILQYEITCEIKWSRNNWKQIFALKFDPAKGSQSVNFGSVTAGLDTIQDFLIKFGIKPCLHILKISFFSLNHVIVRPTKN